MPPRFFELHDDVQLRGRWHLDSPTNPQGHPLANEWQLKQGAPVSIQERVKVPIEIAGTPLDYTEAGLRIPVVHVRVAALFAELAPDDVQLIPVDIEGHPEQYLILVATRLICCIDEQASEIQRWTPEDGLPEKAGQYAIVSNLRIDKDRAGDARVFRPEGWSGALIVREDLKQALERLGATGVKFTEV